MHTNRSRTWTGLIASVGLALVVLVPPGIASGSPGKAAPSATGPKRFLVEEEPFAVPSSPFTSGTGASCSGGRFALSGGVFVGSTSLDVNVTISSPAGVTGWSGAVRNSSGQSVTAAVQVLCAKEPKDYGIVVSTNFHLFPGQTNGHVTCPAGTKVLGGGASTTLPTSTVFLESSYPSAHLRPQSYSWEVTMDNPNGASGTFVVLALCGKEPGYAIEVGSGVENPVGTRTTAGIDCTAGKTAIAGGVYANYDFFLSGVNIGSTWWSTNGWWTSETNDSSESAVLYPYVICAT